MTLQRNLDGYTDISVDDPLRALPFLDPTRWSIFNEDFLFYDVAQGSVKYTLTQTSGVDTITGPTGVLLLTLGGSNNDLAQLQTVEAPFQLTAGKKAIYEARVRIDRATGTIGEEELIIGLTSIQQGADLMDAGGLIRTFDDGWCFVSFDGAATWNAMQGEADTFSVELGAASYADLEWQVLSIYYDGSKSFFYVDGTLIATLTTNEPSSILGPNLFIKAGEAQAKVLHTDYQFVAVER